MHDGHLKAATDLQEEDRQTVHHQQGKDQSDRGSKVARPCFTEPSSSDANKLVHARELRMALNCGMLLLLSSNTPKKARCLMRLMALINVFSAVVMIDADERVPYGHLPDVGLGHHRTRERSNWR